MATTYTLPFGKPGHIGYVVRFKTSHTAPAEEGGGHSDCVLPSGAPVGYFGDGLVGNGYVYAYSNFAARRPHYVNMTDARAFPCQSTVLVLNVGAARAKAFQGSWYAMKAKTDGFRIAGNNCSTHASRAFFAAGVLGRPEIDGIDTPQNLFEQIIAEGRAPWISYSGYLDFSPLGSGSDEMLLPFQVTIDSATLRTSSGPGAP
ncbi:hypothetical protein [Rhodovarius lipocyclicus]|uniref:hypothetical protein n=1 Tax=Rhodovarius lipocyclicus TaxID=268410 RepID=UPI001358C35E|nr:hypothetical protein [Rhodovarius lipocyclicus]